MRGECFFCGRKGHYAIECKFLKKVQSNFVKLENKDDASEEVWDFEATYAVDEDASKEEEWDFEATTAVEEDVVEEEDWNLSGQNHELWIEDVDTDDNVEIAANTVIVTKVDDQHEDDVTIENEDEDHVEGSDEFILKEEEIELVATQPGVRDWLNDAGMIKWRCDKEMSTPQGVQIQGEPDKLIETKVLGNISNGCEAEISKLITETIYDQNGETNWKRSETIKNHFKMRQNSSAVLKDERGMSKEKRNVQVAHDKFYTGFNIKRPPDREDQLGIKGEY